MNNITIFHTPSDISITRRKGRKSEKAGRELNKVVVVWLCAQFAGGHVHFFAMRLFPNILQNKYVVPLLQKNQLSLAYQCQCFLTEISFYTNVAGSFFGFDSDLRFCWATGNNIATFQLGPSLIICLTCSCEMRVHFLRWWWHIQNTRTLCVLYKGMT